MHQQQKASWYWKLQRRVLNGSASERIVRLATHLLRSHNQQKDPETCNVLTVYGLTVWPVTCKARVMSVADDIIQISSDAGGITQMLQLSASKITFSLQ